MTSTYQDKLPPVGEDHIDYAIKRVNLNVRRIFLKDAADIRIEKLHEVGPDLYLTVKRPVNPYAAAEDLDPEDRSQWVSIPRIHHRFSIQEVLDALAPNGLQVNDGETAVVDALAEVGINVAPEDIAIEVMYLNKYNCKTDWCCSGHPHNHYTSFYIVTSNYCDEMNKALDEINK